MDIKEGKRMTATILRMTRPENPRTSLDRCLTGHYAQGPAPGGPLTRMQNESALRRYVRSVARRHPLGGGNGEDVWQQVEDVLAYVPSLASSVRELDDLAHVVRKMLTGRGDGRLKTMDAHMRSCRIGMSVHRSSLRMRLVSSTGSRILTLRLSAAGVSRLDDRSIAP